MNEVIESFPLQSFIPILLEYYEAMSNENLFLGKIYWKSANNELIIFLFILFNTTYKLQ